MMSDGRKLLGKWAIVTGSNRGIGRAVLELFAQNGACIWAHSRVETQCFMDDVKALAEKYSVDIRPLFFDLTDHGGMKEAVKTVRAAKLPVDILVNNAGVPYTSLFQMSRIEDLRRVFDVNFFAVYEFTQYISKFMTKQRSGSIVNVASSSAQDANKGVSAYGSSKAAVVCMSRVIAAELGEFNVRCNCVAPGMTDTDMVRRLTEDKRQYTIQNTIMKRLARSDEIAQTILFLASDEASYITGEVFRVAGGLEREE